MIPRRGSALLRGLIFFSLIGTLTAGEPAALKPPPATDPFRPGALEWEILVGSTANAHFPGARKPGITLTGGEIRLGLMLTARHLEGWLRGNEEAFGFVLADAVTRGPGSYLAGGGVGIRHNFLSGNERIVPYFQGSFAFSGNDIWHNRQQTQIGGAIEFITRADIGLRIRFTPGSWLRLETGYEHISNARIYRRNDSFNGLGGKVGFSWSY